MTSQQPLDPGIPFPVEGRGRWLQRRVVEGAWWFPGLLPLVPLYAMGWAVWHGLWKLRRSYRPPVFTVGVGNLTVGGTGKTPLVAFLASFFRLQNLRVAVFSRGWGRRTSRPLKVTRSTSVRDTGDEPWLLAQKLGEVDVWVGRDRRALVEAHGRNYDVAILDDAFQHRRVRPHVHVLLFDRRSLQGPRVLLPAGPYREPFSRARDADAFVIHHKADEVDVDLEVPLRRFSRPVFHVRYASVYFFHPATGEAVPIDKWRQPVYAFCGIADPGSFGRMLVRFGVEVRGFRAYPDHHVFSPKELHDLRRWAGETVLVTTEKDWVRFQRAWPNLWVVRTELEEVPVHGGTLTDFLQTRQRQYAAVRGGVSADGTPYVDDR